MGFVHQFWQLTIDGLMSGSLYAVIALGYTLVYGVLQLINFAHSEVFMLGAFGGLFAARGRARDPGRRPRDEEGGEGGGDPARGTHQK